MTYVNALVISLGLAFAGAVVASCIVWRVWMRQEEQRERLRQLANGGVADMPRWLQLNERRKR